MRLIEQDIPLEMRYKPTVAYQGSEVAPRTVYLDAHGRMGTSNLPEHLRRMTDPRQLQSFNPDPNAQATALVNAAVALDGATRPTVVRKLDGETVKMVFENHERTPALPGRRTLAQIREGRSRNVPLQTASLADLCDAFEEGRSGMTAATARGLRARFAKHPVAARGIANIARAKEAARHVDPVTGIDMQAFMRMPASVKNRLLEAKTVHHGAKAPILFHPRKTGYKTPGTPGYRGPTRQGLKPDVRIQGFGATVPGTAQESYNAGAPRTQPLSSPSAAGNGMKKIEELTHKNNQAANHVEQGMTPPVSPEDREKWAAQQQALENAHSPQVSENGTVSWQIDNGTVTQATNGRCGWKCWLLLALTAAGVGSGAYTLMKK